MKIHAYCFHSHSYHLAAAQASLLRKHVEGLTQITAVQGPFGLNPMTSSGETKIPNAKCIGSDRLICAPQSLLGLHQQQRFAMKRDWMWSLAASQDEEVALMLHGDILPVVSMTASSLLKGADFATRTLEGLAVWTWAAYDVQKCIHANIRFPSTVTWTVESHGEKPLNATGYDAGMLSEHDWELHAKTIGQRPAAYGKAIRFEWCNPGWLHVDKVSSSITDPISKDRWKTKMEIVRSILDYQNMDVSLDDPSESIEGLIWTPSEHSKNTALSKPPMLSHDKCVHRGEQVGKTDCKGCSGNVRIKLFACEVHGQCQRSAKEIKGAKSCVGCKDAME